MANRWQINEDAPPKGEEHDWRLPRGDQEHVEQTTAMGDLRIRPEDITLIPTISPERSGIQHGADDWDMQSQPDDSAWYVQGIIIQEDN